MQIYNKIGPSTMQIANRCFSKDRMQIFVQKSKIAICTVNVQKRANCMLLHNEHANFHFCIVAQFCFFFPGKLKEKG